MSVQDTPENAAGCLAFLAAIPLYGVVVIVSVIVGARDWQWLGAGVGWFVGVGVASSAAPTLGPYLERSSPPRVRARLGQGYGLAVAAVTIAISLGVVGLVGALLASGPTDSGASSGNADSSTSLPFSLPEFLPPGSLVTLNRATVLRAFPARSSSPTSDTVKAGARVTYVCSNPAVTWLEVRYRSALGYVPRDDIDQSIVPTPCRGT